MQVYRKAVAVNKNKQKTFRENTFLKNFSSAVLKTSRKSPLLNRKFFENWLMVSKQFQTDLQEKYLVPTL